ncbi:hypothetical protein E4U41_000461 [Claviceps citrina]|nr:hypothetical protein E4U41_000461 [Claviceps citrina]
MRYLFPSLTLVVLALASRISLVDDGSVTAPNATSTPAPGTPSGAYCECGYTYCASVLMAMTSACQRDPGRAHTPNVLIRILTARALVRLTECREIEKPWTTKQLAEAYCATPHAVCSSGKPSTGINTALYICLCNDAGQKFGNTLDLVCACDKCLVAAPDFRGRCETPCHSGQCRGSMEGLG